MRRTLHGIRNFLVGVHPLRLALLGYVSYILLGWILLCLPFAQRGPGADAVDAVFTSTSAVSTTGLVTVDISRSYSLFGQGVILALIQLGGIGYMTLSSFVILSRKRNLSDWRKGIGNVIFSLPTSFRIDKFIKSVVLFTVIIEGAGAAILYVLFTREHQPNALWSAVFHSVSSFCTAGFSLNSNSLESFVGNFWVNFVVGALSYLGAVGFIVFVDVWRRFTNKIHHVTLTTKIILHSTFWVSLVGFVVFFLSEPSIRSMPLEERLISSFFQVMTALTTVGFNTIKISAISRASLLILTMLMIIGASPSGTGGGLKSTTFTALIGVMKSTIKGERGVYFHRRKIPERRIRLAVATSCFYVTFLVVGVYFLSLTEKFDFEALLFEAASALGTVGLSTGITSSLTSVAKIVLILLMFAGRIGPLTFGISLFLNPKPTADEIADDVAV
jgi:trk system potassium uptake protein TrkH